MSSFLSLKLNSSVMILFCVAWIVFGDTCSSELDLIIILLSSAAHIAQDVVYIHLSVIQTAIYICFLMHLLLKSNLVVKRVERRNLFWPLCISKTLPLGLLWLHECYVVLLVRFCEVKGYFRSTYSGVYMYQNVYKNSLKRIKSTGSLTCFLVV